MTRQKKADLMQDLIHNWNHSDFQMVLNSHFRKIHIHILQTLVQLF
jgi:hypothetical protein